MYTTTKTKSLQFQNIESKRENNKKKKNLKIKFLYRTFNIFLLPLR